MPAPLCLGRSWRPLLLVLALIWRPGLSDARMRSDPSGFGSSGWGGEANKKASKTRANCQDKKSWKSHRKVTPIHGEDAPNVFDIHSAKHYPNCEPYNKMWQDALNGNFQDGVRLVDNKLVRNGRWCVPTSLVHRVVADHHDELHLTTSSVEKHWKEIYHSVEGEGLYKAVELQCQTCPSYAIHTHDTKRKQGYMTPMPIPVEPMSSIALNVFYYPSTSLDGDVYDRMFLCLLAFWLPHHDPFSSTSSRRQG